MFLESKRALRVTKYQIQFPEYGDKNRYSSLTSYKSMASDILILTNNIQCKNHCPFNSNMLSFSLCLIIMETGCKFLLFFRQVLKNGWWHNCGHDIINFYVSHDHDLTTLLHNIKDYDVMSLLKHWIELYLC